MAHSIDRIIRAVVDHPWAILPERLEAVVAVLARRSHAMLSTAEIAAVVGPRAPSGVRLISAENGATYDGGPQGFAALERDMSTPSGGVIAQVPILGMISHRAAMVEDVSGPGGTSLETFSRTFAAVDANDAVSHILLEVDSPGGSVAMVEETATMIRAASTPTTVHINTIAASAAYWLASAADSISITPSGQVGSIGVIAAHEDHSEADAQAGIKVTFVAAGEGKTEGNAHEPLSDRALADITQKVEGYYDRFVAAVVAGRLASGRDTTQAMVRDFWGADMFLAAPALQAGLVDRVETIDAALGRIMTEFRTQSSNTRAAEQSRAVRARRAALLGV